MTIETNVFTKQSIFDVFYSVKETSRSGGGKNHKKMSSNNVSLEKINLIKKSLNGDKDMLKYFEKLHNRPKNIAPPPRPN